MNDPLMNSHFHLTHFTHLTGTNQEKFGFEIKTNEKKQCLRL